MGFDEGVPIEHPWEGMVYVDNIYSEGGGGKRHRLCGRITITEGPEGSGAIIRGFTRKFNETRNNEV